MESPERPVLLIPDVHQDADFLGEALSAGMAAGIGEAILMGDLLDGRTSATRTSRAAGRTLGLVEDLVLGQNPPTTLLWGNHDFKYWLHREIVSTFSEVPDVALFIETAVYDLSLHTLHALSGSTRRRQSYGRLATIWGRHAKLAVYRKGHVISHAGIHKSFWPACDSVEDGIDCLNDRMKRVQSHPACLDPHGLTGAGKARHGKQETGGPLWLDWDLEFEDDLPFPQIVGHTPDPSGARRKGNAWCLDGGQTTFAILNPDESLEVRSA